MMKRTRRQTRQGSLEDHQEAHSVQLIGREADHQAMKSSSSLRMMMMKCLKRILFHQCPSPSIHLHPTEESHMYLLHFSCHRPQPSLLQAFLLLSLLRFHFLPIIFQFLTLPLHSSLLLLPSLPSSRTLCSDFHPQLDQLHLLQCQSPPQCSLTSQSTPHLPH